MLKYLCYYGNEKCREKRYYVLSATNKIDYISHAIKNNNLDVEIISLSSSINKKAKSYQIETKHGIPVIMPPSISKKNKITRFLERFYIKSWLKKQLNKLTEKDDVIVYHSLGYMKTVACAKKKKNFNLILEVEEIYSDVTRNEKTKRQELEFFKLADAYVFSTELLNEKINLQNKLNAVVYGTYEKEQKISKKFDDNKVHIVYAGTFDVRKGGVNFAIETAEFLDENYHVHILGFGNPSDVENVKKKIDSVRAKTKCFISYDGLKSGDEYIKFIQSCHIGLSTQNPNAQFNDTSFPSKILSYMSNGLRVVSVNIPVVKASKLSKEIYYYDGSNPQEIANTIKSINYNDGYSGEKIIEELDSEFACRILELLKEKNKVF